ncbi:hypothetical protein CRUP_033306, partial [Coryphaenoides rupestris]
ASASDSCTRRTRRPEVKPAGLCTSSRKDVYVDLHLKHVASTNAADFSSDEEDHVVDDAEEAEPTGVDMLDPSGLTDDDLRATLAKHGVRAGPILASTRALYERRLQKILKKCEPKETSMNGTGDAYAYSDSEEEGRRRRRRKGTKKWRRRRRRRKSQIQKSPEKRPAHMWNRLLKQTNRCYLKAVPIRAGITATCRKPIKGAAGRPVRYRYPDAVAPPASPLTLQRREVERRLAPVYVQVLVFLVMAALLYLAYACTEEEGEDEGGDDAAYSNPLLPLLDGLSNIMESVVGGAAATGRGKG